MTCVSKSDFLKICKNGDYSGWSRELGLDPIRSAIGLSDREQSVEDLYVSAGGSVVSTSFFGVKGGTCVWEFSISGTHKGTNIYREYSCPIHSLKRKDGNKLYPWMVFGSLAWMGNHDPIRMCISRWVYLFLENLISYYINGWIWFNSGLRIWTLCDENSVPSG